MSNETVTITAKASDFWKLGYLITDLEKIKEARKQYTLPVGTLMHVSGPLQAAILDLIEKDRKQAIEELTGGTPIDNAP